MLRREVFKRKLEGEVMFNGSVLTYDKVEKRKRIDEEELNKMNRLIKEFIAKGGKIKYYGTNTEPDDYIELTPTQIKRLKARKIKK